MILSTVYFMMVLDIQVTLRAGEFMLFYCMLHEVPCNLSIHNTENLHIFRHYYTYLLNIVSHTEHVDKYQVVWDRVQIPLSSCLTISCRLYGLVLHFKDCVLSRIELCRGGRKHGSFVHTTVICNW